MWGISFPAKLQFNRTMRSTSIPASHSSRPDGFALVIPIMVS